MVIVRLKCGEYYDFFKIKKAFVDNDFITITGSLGKGKRYKEIILSKETLTTKSLRQLMSFLEEEKKRFDYVGLCPYCDSKKTDEWFKAWVYKPINEAKIKYKINRLEPKKESNYHCLDCKKNFSLDQLKHTNTILYY